jgi:hypothetical protein
LEYDEGNLSLMTYMFFRILPTFVIF